MFLQLDCPLIDKSASPHCAFWMQSYNLGRMRRALISLALLGALLVGDTACVERLLQVRSDPPGAKVFVNGDEVGTTPLDHAFTFYGTVEVMLRAKGCMSYRELKPLYPPWYEIFPIDFFSEILLPIHLTDVHTVEVSMTPGSGELSETQRTDLEKKAGELRAALPEADDRRKPER
jgi:hypothetical protein